MPTIDPPKIPRNTLGLRDAKRAVRERAMRERDQMPEALPTAAGQAIAATLMARPDFTQAQTVLVTLPFGSEWDTRPLLSAAVEQGKTVVMPRVNSASRMLELYAITDPHHDVAPGFGGIPEPQAHCPAVMVGAIDWVLVPGVVFDTSGSRIGYGGGYYDRLLPMLRVDARRVAGAFELQIVDNVPAAAHDLAVDTIVTERRVLEIAR